jgi:hypothetical protein
MGLSPSREGPVVSLQPSLGHRCHENPMKRELGILTRKMARTIPKGEIMMQTYKTVVLATSVVTLAGCAAGHSDSNPVASNNTESGHAKNRRVEVIVT